MNGHRADQSGAESALLHDIAIRPVAGLNRRAAAIKVPPQVFFA